MRTYRNAHSTTNTYVPNTLPIQCIWNDYYYYITFRPDCCECACVCPRYSHYRQYNTFFPIRLLIFARLVSFCLWPISFSPSCVSVSMCVCNLQMLTQFVKSKNDWYWDYDDLTLNDASMITSWNSVINFNQQKKQLNSILEACCTVRAISSFSFYYGQFHVIIVQFCLNW